MSHVLDFAIAIAEGRAPTESYGLKATPVVADRAYVADSEDSNKIKMIELGPLLGGGDHMMNANLVNTSGASRTHSGGSQAWALTNVSNLTFTASTTTTLNSPALNLNTNSLNINATSSATPASITLNDGDDTNNVTLSAPLDATGNFTLSLPTALPANTGGQAVLAVTSLSGGVGQLGYVSLDGNRVNVIRGNATTGVEPTAAEVPSAANGDTAAVFLSNGTTEYWAHNGTAWALTNTVAAGSTDTHLMSVNQTNATAAAILHQGGNQNWGIAGIDNLTFQAVTAQATNAGGSVWGWSNDRTINAGAYTTGAKLEGTVGAATQLLGTTATGDFVQVATGGLSDTNTHIFDDGLANQGANATHVQAGFDVTFDQATANSALIFDNGTNAVAIQDGSLKVRRGAAGQWVTFDLTLIGAAHALNLTTTEAALP